MCYSAVENSTGLLPAPATSLPAEHPADSLSTDKPEVVQYGCQLCAGTNCCIEAIVQAEHIFSTEILHSANTQVDRK